MTIASVVSHSHNVISILRYKYSEPKLFLTEEIVVCDNCEDPTLLPYSCELADFGRLAIVKCYDGSVKLFRIREGAIDLEALKGKQGGIAVEE